MTTTASQRDNFLPYIISALYRFDIATSLIQTFILTTMVLLPETRASGELSGSDEVDSGAMLDSDDSQNKETIPKTSTSTGATNLPSIRRKEPITDERKPDLPTKPRWLITFQGKQPLQATGHQDGYSKLDVPTTSSPAQTIGASNELPQVVEEISDSTRSNSLHQTVDYPVKRSSKNVFPINMLAIDKHNNCQTAVEFVDTNHNFIQQEPLNNGLIIIEHPTPEADCKSNIDKKVAHHQLNDSKIVLKSHRTKQQVNKQDEDKKGSLSASATKGSKGCGEDNQLKPPFPFAGILVGIAGSLMVSTSILFVKLLGGGDSFEEKLQALLSRSIFISFFCTIAIIVQKGTIRIQRDEILINAMRAVFGYAGVMGLYLSLRYISIGDATALLFLSPIWTSLLGHYILGEPLAWIIFMLLPVSLFGTILIAHPTVLVDINLEWFQVEPTISGQLNQTSETDLNALPDDLGESFEISQRWPGILLAASTSFWMSCVYLVLKLKKTTPVLTTTFWLGIYSIIVTLIIMYFVGFGHLPDGVQCAYLFFNGFFSWTSQIAMQWCLKYESPSIVSMIRTLDVAASFCFSALFLDDEIYWTSIVGASIISAVVVVIILNNYIQNQPKRG